MKVDWTEDWEEENCDHKWIIDYNLIYDNYELYYYKCNCCNIKYNKNLVNRCKRFFMCIRLWFKQKDFDNAYFRQFGGI